MLKRLEGAPHREIQPEQEDPSLPESIEGELPALIQQEAAQLGVWVEGMNPDELVREVEWQLRFGEKVDHHREPFTDLYFALTGEEFDPESPDSASFDATNPELRAYLLKIAPDRVN